MEHQNREPFDEAFEDEDWQAYGWIGPGVQSAQPSDLTDSIHSIFSHLKPSPGPNQAPLPRWITEAGPLTTEEYDLMTPSLRLASKMIASPASVKFLHTLWKGHRRGSGHSHREVPVVQMHKTTQSDAETRREVEATLEKLSESISFDFESAPAGDNYYGWTYPTLEAHPSGIQILPESTVKGVACKVHIDRKYLKALRAQAQTPQSRPGQLQKTLNLQFRLAVTLCHELIHGAYFATENALLVAFIDRASTSPHLRSTIILNDPFYEDEICAEVGYCWENLVFGGVIGQEGDFVNDPLWVVEWPSFQNYKPGKYPLRKLLSRISISYLVSTFYVQNIQTAEFWLVVGSSHTALHIRKTLGVKMNAPAGNVMHLDRWAEPLPEEDVDPNTQRVKRTYVDPDLASKRANETTDAKITRFMDESMQ